MQEAAQSLVFFVLVIGIMLGGMNILASTSKPTKRAYDAMFKHLLANPTRKLLRYMGKQLSILLHFLLRQTWRGICFVSRRIWVWLTT